MSPAQKTYLGFDFGERRIGVAVGQTHTGTATPLTILRSRQGQPDWARIEALLEEWRADALVVGLPLNMDGSEQAMTRLARRFGNQLAGRFAAVVHFADERLSTREARSRPAPRRGRKHDLHDAVAAQVILESWMDEQPSGCASLQGSPE